jgi:hypothetical protein
MHEVTRILPAIEAGDPSAAEQLLPLVYDELRQLAAQRLAQEKPGQTLQATALVHEAYLRLVDVEKAQQWNSRGHFFGAAAEAVAPRRCWSRPPICLLSMPVDSCEKASLTASTLPELSVMVALLPMLVKLAELMTSSPTFDYLAQQAAVLDGLHALVHRPAATSRQPHPRSGAK